MGKPRIVLLPTPMVRKASGQFKKLFGLWEKNKSKNKTNPMPLIKEGKPTFLNNNLHVTTGFITRRQIVLNRHFTEIISDILAINLRKELVEMKVNITSIETKAWNKGVRIFYTTSEAFNSDLHSELNQLVTKLRSAISERRLIGRTPLVNFVYDESAMLDQDLSIALKNANIPLQKDETSVEKISFDQLQLNDKPKRVNVDRDVDQKSFSAPVDMTNMTLGLNYPSLYNEISSKLARGRGESSRKFSETSLASTTKPLFRAPLDHEVVEDARTRVLNMQKFLVNQKKKSEYFAKLRRKEELLERDRYKWDMPDSENDVYL